MLPLAIPTGLLILTLVLICIGPGRLLALGSTLTRRLAVRRRGWTKYSDEQRHCSDRRP